MPLLRLTPGADRRRDTGSPNNSRPPEAYPATRQRERFSPQFNRLSEVLTRDSSGLELRADPTALAPERLLVFEVRGSISGFAGVVRKVPGLEMVDEEDIAPDEDKQPVAYLLHGTESGLTGWVDE